MGKGNYASNIRKLEKSYKSGLTKPNMEGLIISSALEAMCGRDGKDHRLEVCFCYNMAECEKFGLIFK